MVFCRHSSSGHLSLWIKKCCRLNMSMLPWKRSQYSHVGNNWASPRRELCGAGGMVDLLCSHRTVTAQQEDTHQCFPLLITEDAEHCAGRYLKSMVLQAYILRLCNHSAIDRQYGVSGLVSPSRNNKEPSLHLWLINQTRPSIYRTSGYSLHTNLGYLELEKTLQRSRLVVKRYPT